MAKHIPVLLLSLLMPGLGYFHIGDKASFYKVMASFFGTIILSVPLRLFTRYSGVLAIIVILTTIYIFAAVHAALKAKSAGPPKHGGGLKVLLTLAFFFVTTFSFANRRTVMGFDIMRMDVPAMQPTVMPGEKFLVDTWAYKNGLPKRGDVIVHSFSGQPGLYVNRIIAAGKDTVELRRGTVLLNGRILAEPYVLPAVGTGQPSRDMKVIIIPEGHYFVMGDNRDASLGDSRFSGSLTAGNIIGKVTDIISSPYKLRRGSTVK